MGASLAARVQQLQKMDSGELAVKYEELFGAAPRRRHKEWLRRRIAWELQARELGGLTDDDQTRIQALATEHDPFSREVTKPRRKGQPTQKARTVRPRLGTFIEREYRGVTHEITVVEDGFLYLGQTYRSLTALAKLITGAHWNGPLFFGLR